MKRVALTCTILVVIANLASGQTTEEKISRAIQALPESMRAGASVVEYDAMGYRTVLREGTNSLVCEPDDPTVEGFRVTCYHQNRIARLNFERQLAASGKSAAEVFQTRSAKVDAGELPLPVAGQMGYFLGGANEASAVPTRSVRLPYATAASTGLPTGTDESEGVWLMQAGTNRAHIMIVGTPSGTPPMASSTETDKAAAAVLAAPAALRAGATVVDYDEYGDRHILRQGTNTLVCEPDDPNTEGFTAWCYQEGHVSRVNFEKKVAATSNERAEVFRQRVQAVEAGKIPLPVAGQMQYILSGDSLGTATRRGQVARLPYATSASTGLPEERSHDGIWLMQAGTNRAHIMIMRP